MSQRNLNKVIRKKNKYGGGEGEWRGTDIGIMLCIMCICVFLVWRASGVPIRYSF